MFGYIVLNKPEVKFKDFDIYSSFYCGLCQALKKNGGIAGQLTLSYDLTFVVLLLCGLYEPEIQVTQQRCMIHPIHKRTMRQCEITEYAAEMNTLLSYYKCIDDWNDEKKYTKRVYAELLKKACQRIERKYPEKVQRIKRQLMEMSELEKTNEQNLDIMAGCFGKIMEEIVCYKEDLWEPSIRRMGFFLGKFIYLLDAFDDIEEDIKNNSYNPLLSFYKEKGFEEKISQILMLMITECCREFEKLPIIENADLLRNILYSGVWIQYSEICRKRKEKQEIKHD